MKSELFELLFLDVLGCCLLTAEVNDGLWNTAPVSVLSARATLVISGTAECNRAAQMYSFLAPSVTCLLERGIWIPLKTPRAWAAWRIHVEVAISRKHQ